MSRTLTQLYHSYAGKKAVSVLPIAGAGSDRRYFRMDGVIGVEGQDRDENRAFIALSRHFAAKGLPVPRVLAVSEDGMCYLEEDLGNVSLYDVVSEGRSSGNYSAKERAFLCDCISQLPDFQFRGAEGLDFSICYPEPEFGSRMVLFDLNYFKYCFLKATGVNFNEILLQDDFERLREDLTLEPADAFMYRDFQARNVMVRGGKLYFIDFQGGRKGPIYYDVASFVWQAKARYPADLKEELLRCYLLAAGRYIDVDETGFRGRLRLFVLFRMLQVLGAYGFRGYYERKPHFLGSVPFAIANLRELLKEPFERYPYLCEVLSRMVGCIAPYEGVVLSLPGVVGSSLAAPDGTGNPVVGSAAASVVNDAAGDAAIAGSLEVSIYSFSYKNGIPQDESGNGGGYVFDCRGLNNPGRYWRYRNSTGRDADVIEFLEEDGGITIFLNHVYAIVDTHVKSFLDRGFTHLQISFGCTGGQHRSVYSAEHLAAHLAGVAGVKVTLVHRELEARQLL